LIRFYENFKITIKIKNQVQTSLIFLIFEQNLDKIIASLVPNIMNLRFYILLMTFFLLIHENSSAQQDSIRITSENMFMYPSKDSIPVFDLSPVIILPKMHFNNYRELKYFWWIRRRVYKVYPFARLSGINVEKLDQRLAKMSKSDRKRYMRIVKRWIKKEFEPKLKNLTQSEGRILSKLFYRQTGQTVFDFLKKYKNSWTAFWYQNIAKLYHIDLKVKFDPFNVKEDYWIEYILQKAFINEILEPQPNKLGYKFIDLQNKWAPPPIDKFLKEKNKKTFGPKWKIKK